jgi:hypothetical protein
MIAVAWFFNSKIYKSNLIYFIMEQTFIVEVGDKARLKVLLDPIYKIGNEIACAYRSEGYLKEFHFRLADLEQAPYEKEKLVLVKELTIEEIHNELFVCKIDGYRQKFLFPLEDLEILEMEAIFI